MVQRKLTLPVVAPFRLDFTAWALRRRKTNIVDRWDEGRYSRVFIFENHPVRIVIAQEGTNRDPNLCLTLQGQKAITGKIEKEALALIKKMFGAAIDLQPFYQRASENEPLRDLAAVFSGIKPPRFPNLFEALVNSISCQQLTLDLGILLLNRLAERFGIGFDVKGITQYAFPRPQDLENIAQTDIKDLGYSTQKARAIKELAGTFLRHATDFAHLDKMANEEIVDYLTKLRGIGRWSAEYALLRGLGRLDIFPGDDVGARNNLQKLLHLQDKPDYEGIKQLTSQWHPYEGLVYFHLLLDKLRQKGFI